MTRSVITPLAPICRAPDDAASLDTEALFGEQVAVDDITNGYAHVELATDGYQGWMPAHCLGDLPPPTHQIMVPHSFVTAAADVKSRGQCHLSLGARIHVMAIDNGFSKISLADGFGWVPDCHIAALSAPCDDWVRIAESFLGSPYRWGGRASTGLDCSALVQLSLAAGGHAVPRDSGPQHEIGTPLDDAADLRRGDLVFWAGHVGIMLDRHRLLHANAHHMAVAIEPLPEAAARIAASAGPITAYRRPACP